MGILASPDDWCIGGSYSSLWEGFIDDAIEDLTSWPVDKVQISKYADPSKAWRQKTNQTLGAFSMEGPFGLGRHVCRTKLPPKNF